MRCGHQSTYIIVYTFYYYPNLYYSLTTNTFKSSVLYVDVISRLSLT